MIARGGSMPPLSSTLDDNSANCPPLSTTPFLYTESAGNVSQTSFEPDSVPRTWKSRDSRAHAVDARSTFLITDIIK